MLKGGYQIIDLQMNELSSTPSLITGLYNKLLKNHNKVVLLANIGINGNFKDYYVQPVLDSTGIKCTIGNKTITVTSSDYISVADGVVGGTDNYEDLENKPKINDITLEGNMSAASLGLNPTTIGISIEFNDANTPSIPTTAGQSATYTESLSKEYAYINDTGMFGSAPFQLNLSGLPDNAYLTVNGVCEHWSESDSGNPFSLFVAGWVFADENASHLYSLNFRADVDNETPANTTFTITVKCIS